MHIDSLTHQVIWFDIYLARIIITTYLARCMIFSWHQLLASLFCFTHCKVDFNRHAKSRFRFYPNGYTIKLIVIYIWCLSTFQIVLYKIAIFFPCYFAIWRSFTFNQYIVVCYFVLSCDFHRIQSSNKISNGMFNSMKLFKKKKREFHSRHLKN